MPTLQSLIRNLPVKIIGDPGVEIGGIRYDSRQVGPGDLFACLPGTKVHGHRFISEVTAAGAAALLVEDAELAPAGVPTVVSADSRETLAWMSAAFYDYPADSLTLVGVTGTNGKTTVTTLLWRILRAAGHPAGLIGTMAYHIGDEVLKAPHTTPQSPDLQELLAKMRDAGLTHAVMEVSSHALCQHRVTGCRFAAAAFTNLTQDHLDYHGTLEAYREAKLDLFANPRYQPVNRRMIGVINADDPSAPLFVKRALGPVRQFGLTGGDYRAVDIELRPDGSSFQLLHPRGTTPVILQLVGSFNVSNALAALALAIELGIDSAVATGAAALVPPVDGRFQRVPASGNGKPTVVVDYAHTPDGLEKVLSTAHEIAPGRVVVVFGCGGDRDRTKRPKMAAVTAKWARDIIVTSDNPRSEVPGHIIDDILAGFTSEQMARVRVEPDRAAAIRQAVSIAAPADLVVLAGKGHEDYQIFADRTIHFDDREEAARILAKLPGTMDKSG